MSAPLLPVALPGTSPIPRSTLIAEAIGASVMATLAALGLLDGALPALVRVEIVPVSTLVIAVMALAHHSTLQAAQAAAAAAGQVLQTAAGTAGEPGIPSWLPTAGNNAAQVMAGIGAAIEASRQGVVATADTGRHQAAPASWEADTERHPLIPAQTTPSYPPPVAPAAASSPLIGA